MREWFSGAFEAPTRPQTLGWPAIARGDSTLILAPTGSGKTLAAFLSCLDRLMFTPEPPKASRCRVLYVSPLKALAVDVERNLRAPLAGIAQAAERRGDSFVTPAIAIRTGDTPQSDRARFQREPADILITTPESLYLLLTSNAREALRSIDTVIIDEIHALVPTKRGAHLMLSIERLAALPHAAAAAHRPVRDAAAARRSGPLPRRRRARVVAAPEVLGAEAEIADEFATHQGDVRYRPVTIVDAGAKKALKLTIEVPVEDMARLTTADDTAERARVGRRRAAVDLVGHPPAAARTDPRPSLDARSSSTAAGWRNASPAR